MRRELFVTSTAAFSENNKRICDRSRAPGEISDRVSSGDLVLLSLSFGFFQIGGVKSDNRWNNRRVRTLTK